MRQTSGQADRIALMGQDDTERIVAHVPQADFVSRILIAREVVLVDPAVVSFSASDRTSAIDNGNLAETRQVRFVQRQFESGRLQVSGQYVRVLRIDNGVFRRLLEEILGMSQQVLIDGIVAGYQNRQTIIVSPSATASLLPGAGDRSRVIDQQRHIERPDINAQFQRVCGGDAPQPAGEEILLDLSPFVRQVAAAISAHGIGERVSPFPQLVLSVPTHKLGRLSSAREGQTLSAPLDRFNHQPHRVITGAVSSQRIVADRRRIPQHKILRSAGRAVVVDDLQLRRPISREVNSPGLAIVALAARNVGDAP